MEITAMPNRRYRSGVRLEREIREIFEKSFNVPCFRTAGSKSDFDLIALGGRYTLLIQVKYTSKKNLKPSQKLIEKMKEYVFANHELAVIIIVQRQTRMTLLGCLRYDSEKRKHEYTETIDIFSEIMRKLWLFWL
jgi:Holliday junction resolvase